MTKQTILFDGDTFTHAGMQFIVSFEHDGNHGAPWEEQDGHGPVSEYTRRDKKPGEWVLSSDRSSKRFYDASEATRIAKRDGWGLGDEEKAKLATKLGRTATKGEVTAESVRRDFEYLRGWANDKWHYVGVCVRHVSQDADERYSYATWGIESDCDENLTEVAHKLADECGRAIESEIAANRATLKTIRHQFKALAADLRKSATLAPAICDAVKSKLQSLMNDRAQAMARIAELSI